MSRESDIGIVSLARYADSCPPAVLHSDCPFAVVDAVQGGRSCQVECRDVLTALVSPHRENAPAIPVFDAGELMFQARNLSNCPSALWPTSALLTVLVQVTRSTAIVPGEADLHLVRFIEGTSALAYLMQRGLNGQELISYGFGPAIAAAIDVHMAVQDVNGISTESDPWPGHAYWSQIRKSLQDESARPQDALHFNLRFQQILRSWIATTTPPEVLSWTPPVETDLVDLRAWDEGKAAEYSWFISRMTRTYPQDWSLDDLKLEYRMMTGDWRPSWIPPSLVVERTEDRSTVSEAIAKILIIDEKADPNTQAALTSQAVAFINNGQREQAATVFLAARAMEPTNADWSNNYAFCILPDNPKQALTVLSETQQLGRDDVVVRANMALAHILEGQLDEALEILDAAFPLTGGPTEAFLWVFDETGDNDLHMESVEVRRYICGLALNAAQTLHDDDSIEIWKHRLETVSTSGV